MKDGGRGRKGWGQGKGELLEMLLFETSSVQGTT